ncbi:hypothetical protein KSP39_PZI008753 [Platanthera zijinensis]|uniref:Uncharacterized protein n=1 Tax=Platanthera zijinensis TaxID=2320716 RepID=A0AAP0BM90_9ASPA
MQVTPMFISKVLCIEGGQTDPRNLPITQDASASASQIMSDFLLDTEIAKQTNLETAEASTIEPGSSQIDTSGGACGKTNRTTSILVEGATEKERAQKTARSGGIPCRPYFGTASIPSVR